jgi:hypothetical protein
MNVVDHPMYGLREHRFATHVLALAVAGEVSTVSNYFAPPGLVSTYQLRWFHAGRGE